MHIHMQFLVSALCRHQQYPSRAYNELDAIKYPFRQKVIIMEEFGLTDFNNEHFKKYITFACGLIYTFLPF